MKTLGHYLKAEDNLHLRTQATNIACYKNSVFSLIWVHIHLRISPQMASAYEVQSKQLQDVDLSEHGLIQENCEEKKENLAQEAVQNARIGSRTQWQSKDQDRASGKNQGTCVASVDQFLFTSHHGILQGWCTLLNLKVCGFMISESLLFPPEVCVPGRVGIYPDIDERQK